MSICKQNYVTPSVTIPLVIYITYFMILFFIYISMIAYIINTMSPIYKLITCTVLKAHFLLGHALRKYIRVCVCVCVWVCVCVNYSIALW